MKNSIISILLFIALIIGLLFLNHKFTSLCTDVIEKCERIEILLDEKEDFLAYEESVKLLNYIKDKSDIPALYLNHLDYDLLINESLKLSLYIKGNDKSESLATLHLIKYSAEHLKELQNPNIKNIL